MSYFKKLGRFLKSNTRGRGVVIRTSGLRKTTKLRVLKKNQSFI